MTIEITKKSLIQLIVVAIILILSLYGGYSIGYTKGVTDTNFANENPKGNGEHFFAEEFNKSTLLESEYIIYHSTPKCKAIEKALKMDVAFIDSAYRTNNSKFCSKCMNTYLMTLCEQFLSTFNSK